jgi:2-polyprenyl-3-methyl-5-hydroxy-6-metoxy-1,4-benzoquinol methylase
VAFESPDHQVPHGTKYNNSTNRKFVLLLHDYFRQHAPNRALAMMDLGCSGGQLVADFAALGWIGVGLEGSDYSLKHRRANWAELANQNLFTCDITKPFQVQRNGQKLECQLITSWEVLEHIRLPDLETLFNNISAHLAEGGLFIASTSSTTSVVDGVELHQTRMPNAEWRAWVEARFPDLEPVDLGLKTYQYVRFDFGEASFLLYRKRAA